MDHATGLVVLVPGARVGSKPRVDLRPDASMHALPRLAGVVSEAGAVGGLRGGSVAAASAHGAGVAEADMVAGQGALGGAPECADAGKGGTMTLWLWIALLVVAKVALAVVCAR